MEDTIEIPIRKIQAAGETFNISTTPRSCDYEQYGHHRVYRIRRSTTND